MVVELEVPSRVFGVSQLVDLAARGLPQMVDPEKQLFCYTLRQRKGHLVREGVSPRYTMMTLLGLHRYESAGGKSVVNIQEMFERLTADTNWVDGIGDVGLLLWTCAVLCPECFPAICSQVDVRQALTHFSDGLQCRTMELSWYLTGLSYGLNTGLASVQDLSEQAWTTFSLLKANQGNKGLFGHQSTSKTIMGLVRGQIGSFADQVYPIYAFSQFAKFARKQEIVDRARECAQTIREYQGPNGEWWWHYDAGTGRVVETYPVYSVHQHGMAPMALLALADLIDIDFTGPIQKGLDWVRGRNDLKVDLRSESAKVIWRNFYMPETNRYLRQIVGAARRSTSTPVHKLKVNFECRPYELGWLLYALAGRNVLGSCNDDPTTC